MGYNDSRCLFVLADKACSLRDLRLNLISSIDNGGFIGISNLTTLYGTRMLVIVTVIVLLVSTEGLWVFYLRLRVCDKFCSDSVSAMFPTMFAQGLYGCSSL